MTISDNDYSRFQKDFYTRETPIMKVENHRVHNNNPDYWDVMLAPVKTNAAAYTGKNALDFGCGCGRNLVNLAGLANWANVDGCDISAPNCAESESLMASTMWDTKCKCYPTNGTKLDGVPSDNYDFVMSTIVLQHICVHEVRYSILEDIFRVLKQYGMFSFQMAMGKTTNGHTSDYASYYENAYHARRTNSGYDVDIEKPEYLTSDLEKIGFRVVEVKVTNSFEDAAHPQWVWVKATKP